MYRARRWPSPRAARGGSFSPARGGGRAANNDGGKQALPDGRSLSRARSQSSARQRRSPRSEHDARHKRRRTRRSPSSSRRAGQPPGAAARPSSGQQQAGHSGKQRTSKAKAGQRSQSRSRQRWRSSSWSRARCQRRQHRSDGGAGGASGPGSSGGAARSSAAGGAPVTTRLTPAWLVPPPPAAVTGAASSSSSSVAVLKAAPSLRTSDECSEWAQELEDVKATLRRSQHCEAEERSRRIELEAKSFSLLQAKFSQVVANRIDSEKMPIPGGFEDLVAVLREAAADEEARHAKEADGGGALAPAAALEAAEASRAELRRLQLEVRRAAPAKRIEVIEARDEARRRHVRALREAEAAVLRMAEGGGSRSSKSGSSGPGGSSSSSSSSSCCNATTAAEDAASVFESAIGAVEAALSRAEAGLARARAAATGNPKIGERAPAPRNAAGESEVSVAAALKAWQDYLELCASAAVITTTNSAVLAVRQAMRSTKLFLPDDVGLVIGVRVRTTTSSSGGCPRAAREASPPAKDMSSAPTSAAETTTSSGASRPEGNCLTPPPTKSRSQPNIPDQESLPPAAASTEAAEDGDDDDGMAVDEEQRNDAQTPAEEADALQASSGRAGEVVCIVNGMAYVKFDDDTVEALPESSLERLIEDDTTALARLEDAVCGANAALDAEARFWQGLDEGPATMLPCGQLLATGREVAAALAQSVSALRSGLDQHRQLHSELKDESEALSSEPAAKAVADLAAAAEAHLDAGDALQDAVQAVQRARVRGRPVEPLMEKAEEAKLAAKRADATVRKAMLGLSETTRRFPEVGSDPVVLQHLRISLPQDLMPLWCVGRSLAHFDSRELLAGASRNRLYRAKEGPNEYAIKEYAVAGGAEGLRVCLHEAALLKRARHPHIVEIVGIFADPEEHAFFIQMPFYENGSLDRWVKDSKPDDQSIRRVLAQVVSALAHLHGLGITHADVKPGNILLDRRGVARLGDFDISVDSDTRTSAARIQATSTQVGFTPGFAAPEILRTGASFASDLYALGATIAEVAPRTEERDELLKKLQAQEPRERPTSAQLVLQDPYFSPVFAWAQDERRSCCICLDAGIRLEEGLECGHSGADGHDPHFVCRPCLEQHVQAACGQELRLRQAAEGRVHCPGRPCDADAYTDVDLAKRLAADVFRRYTEARLDLLEQRKAAELEGQMQTRLDAELRRLQALDEQQRRVRAVRNHIVEEILTLKCPRCGQAFLDFVGCFALQCSR
eukprot:TRINITY_DN33192_c0_g1_i2.p1 TRINITY_DN33192_c0_g1~~TRINITY_DN33192_c0_g1_i2.p1  ORF type:complete len:1248 (-),score=333.73 TRINITY_DN33192_c0_g1_i2:377-4120(-)